ncbi:hypothetical protein [Adhaeribacter terreus]|uniref:STAS/SEC14 domain-containing protein n=1 Tax=Adhaeribacter terreus TaxID=529703 RepID=A0ABW0EC92_9BACT
MILGNTQLQFSYDAQKGILYAKWPEFGPYTIQHLEEPFSEIISTLIRCNASKFIIDASHCIINHSDAGFREMMELFVSGLAQTPLRKLARVKRPDSVYANLFDNFFQEISTAMEVDITFKNFATKEEALAWLEE